MTTEDKKLNKDELLFMRLVMVNLKPSIEREIEKIREEGAQAGEARRKEVDLRIGKLKGISAIFDHLIKSKSQTTLEECLKVVPAEGPRIYFDELFNTVFNVINQRNAV